MKFTFTLKNSSHNENKFEVEQIVHKYSFINIFINNFILPALNDRAQRWLLCHGSFFVAITIQRSSNTPLIHPTTCKRTENQVCITDKPLACIDTSARCTAV